MKTYVLILAIACCAFSGEVNPVAVKLSPVQRVRLDSMVHKNKHLRVLEYGQPFMIDYALFTQRIAEVQAAKKASRNGNVIVRHDPDFVLLRANFFSRDEPYIWAYDTAAMVLRQVADAKGKPRYEKQVSGWELHFQDRWIKSFFLPQTADCISDFDVTVNQDTRYRFMYKILFRHLGDNVYVMVKVRAKNGG